jgi:hypothetical protein
VPDGLGHKRHGAAGVCEKSTGWVAVLR